MKKKFTSQRAFLTLRVLIVLIAFSAAALLALFARANQRTLAYELLRPSKVSSFTPSGTPQEAWVAHYDGTGNVFDEATAIAVDHSGDVYVTGRSGGPPSNQFDYATVKYDSAGQEQWVARYNGPESGDDYAEAIAVDDAGNVYVTGTSGTGYATIKYNSAGQQLWVARYDSQNGSGEATALAIDTSGNIYVTGGSSGPDGSTDYATVKYNSDGQQQWVALYSGPETVGGDYANAIAVDDSGNVYVTGESGGSGTSGDYATVKYNSAGQQQWVARYDGPVHQFDGALAIALDNVGNVYVTGSSFGSGGNYDYATIKYSPSGQEQWVARYNGPPNGLDFGLALAVDGSGNTYATGWSEGSGTSDDYATVKYDSAGQQQWVARYNGPGNHVDDAFAIALDGSGNVYVTGDSDGPDGDDDFATIKYNSAGQQQWAARYNRRGNSVDYANAIAIDDFGNIYVTGQSDFDYATIKYVQGATPTPTPTSTPAASPTATPTASPTPTVTPRVTPRPRPTPHARPTPP
jgi:hypothetical protein